MATDKDIDQQHIWHPYSAMQSSLPVYQVASAHGVRLRLEDGRELIDGMSSWWSVIHGYNHPDMNAAISAQLEKMAHVMFGGLTHSPAIELTRLLIDITPASLQSVFYSDSGSVAIEVAMKMAIQYWQALGMPAKQHFISLRHGYHGDTFGAMSVSDPDTGMHKLFQGALIKQHLVAQPACRFGEPCSDEDIIELEQALEEHHMDTAALVLEPVVQGAGGMWFYSAEYLKKARALCEKHNVLLIADEIATGFGRTGKLFACEHAGVTPDIMCIGKALTGGYLTLAATLTTKAVSATIDSGVPGVFMHGPTFMANPLACTAALSSIRLLLKSGWQKNIQRIEAGLRGALQACTNNTKVKEIRVLGAIGVIEMKAPVELAAMTRALVNNGVWLRPFGRLVYLMPPYTISDDELACLVKAVVTVLND